MLLQFALRNVLRNKKRSLLTACSIFIATFIVALAEGWISGILNGYIENTARYQSGHIRITTKNYQKRERFLPADEYIPNSQSIIKKLAKLPQVDRIEQRIKFGLLLGYKEKTVNAIGMGIEFKKNIFNLRQKVYNEQGKKINFQEDGMYIGKKLAKKLDVTIGDTLKLVTKNSTQGINGIKLKISGIVHMGVTKLDETFFFINISDAKKLLKLRTETTEILIFSKNFNTINSLQNKIKNIIPTYLTAPTLRDQNRAMYDYFMGMRKIWYLVESVIIFLASFIIINTMMMAVFERIREIGTMKALGMTERAIFFNFTLEGTIIGTIGGAAGTLLGGVLVAIASHTGINIESAMRGVDLPFEYIIYPEANIIALFTTLFLAILIPALAAMIPAKYTNRLVPADALRKF